MMIITTIMAIITNLHANNNATVVILVECVINFIIITTINIIII